MWEENDLLAHTSGYDCNCQKKFWHCDLYGDRNDPVCSWTNLDHNLRNLPRIRSKRQRSIAKGIVQLLANYSCSGDKSYNQWATFEAMKMSHLWISDVMQQGTQSDFVSECHALLAKNHNMVFTCRSESEKWALCYHATDFKCFAISNHWFIHRHYNNSFYVPIYGFKNSYDSCQQN